MPMVQYPYRFLWTTIEPILVIYKGADWIILYVFIDSYNYSNRWANKNL